MAVPAGVPAPAPRSQAFPPQPPGMSAGQWIRELDRLGLLTDRQHADLQRLRAAEAGPLADQLERLIEAFQASPEGAAGALPLVIRSGDGRPLAVTSEGGPLYPMPVVVRGDASDQVLTWSDAGVTHRPCPQGPIFDRRPRPPVKPVPPSPGHDEGARPDRAPWLHGLRRRLYPERLWWRYITRRCLG